MSKLPFSEFIVRFKTNVNDFWCVSSVNSKLYGGNESNKFIILNGNISFIAFTQMVDNAKSMFSGDHYVGSVSCFFVEKQDIDLLSIKYPELNV